MSSQQLHLVLAILLMISAALMIPRANGLVTPDLTAVSEHHLAELNSDMPYVAGFQVIADNLSIREHVNAAMVTVSFPSVDTGLWPSGSWLGGGMFLQGQDNRYRNVDYAFYMMLVLDASGNMFIDVGLHQTEEATVPLQSSMSTLIYAYTWQISGINASSPVTLVQRWSANSYVDYSIHVSGREEDLIRVNMQDMPNWQNMIPTFYAGNVIIDPFPFSRYINYFQFGIISNRVIADSHWKADIKTPSILRRTGWVPVDKAWLLEGDHSYLDHDLMWGGKAYDGVSVQYYQHPMQNPGEIVLSYTGDTSTAGRVLWDISGTNNYTDAQLTSQNQALSEISRRFLPLIIVVLGITFMLPFLLARRRRR